MLASQYYLYDACKCLPSNMYAHGIEDDFTGDFVLAGRLNLEVFAVVFYSKSYFNPSSEENVRSFTG